MWRAGRDSNPGLPPRGPCGPPSQRVKSPPLYLAELPAQPSRGCMVGLRVFESSY